MKIRANPHLIGENLHIKKVFIFGVLALCIGLFLFKYLPNQQILSSLEKTQPINSDTINKDPNLVEVNKLFELPLDQLGTYGKIKDIKVLEGKKQYFSKGKDGDILIIYDDLTIIYDPVNKNIVDIAKERLLK